MLKSSDVLDMLVPILFNLNDARADQCESEPPCAVCVCGKIKYNACVLSANIQGSLLKTFLLCSSCRPHAHRRVHPAAAERREKLRGPSEQTVHPARPDGHSCFHGNPRRPAHRGKRFSLVKPSLPPLTSFPRDSCCMRVFE